MTLTWVWWLGASIWLGLTFVAIWAQSGSVEAGFTAVMLVSFGAVLTAMYEDHSR